MESFAAQASAALLVVDNIYRLLIGAVLGAVVSKSWRELLMFVVLYPVIGSLVQYKMNVVDSSDILYGYIYPLFAIVLVGVFRSHKVVFEDATASVLIRFIKSYGKKKIEND